MKLKITILTTFMLLGIKALNAQNIKGNVVDQNNEPYLTADLALVNASDSAILKYSVLDSEGKFDFDQVAPGKYRIKVEDLGTTLFSDVFTMEENKSVDLPAIIFQPKTEEMEKVVFTYQRPLIEMKADALVFNVDSTINAIGQNGLELLRKSPGVLLDKDDNISMNGKNGVRVYIDGRMSPLTGTELSEYLKTLQSSSIDAIEIISNPSAKYDAAGNAGVINIKLKKDKLVGTNGSVNAGYAIGKFGKYNGGINLNHRNGKVNVYGGYNINHGKHWSDATFERSLLDSSFHQYSTFERLGTAHNAKAGIDVFIDDKNTIGLMVNGTYRSNENKNPNQTEIAYLPTGEVVTNLISNNTDKSQRNNTNINLNYQFTDKASGRSLTLDGDYGRFDIDNNQYQPNVYLQNGAEYNRNTYQIITPIKIDILSFKADYEQNLFKGKLGLGAKVTNTNTDNNFQYDVLNNNVWLADRDRSNKFTYSENIQAAYAQYQQQLKGWAMQIGVRAENTIAEGLSKGERSTVNGYEAYELVSPRNYFNVFPNVSFTYNKNPMNQWNFKYNKRIDRPNYQDMNPFEMKMTDYTYRKGNINLKPQITNAIAVTHTYKYMLNTRLEYAHTTDVFAELVDTINNGKLFQTKENLATQDIVSLNISMPFAYKRFSSFLNINAYYTMFKADYGNGRKIDLDAFSANVYGQLGYKINDWLNAEVSGWYTAPGIWQGTFKSIAMGGVDAGIQARLWKGKGNLKLSMGDVFNTMKWGGSSNFAGQYVYAYGRWESQQFRVNFTYNFGNNKVKGRQRNTATEEETKRAGESQGLTR